MAIVDVILVVGLYFYSIGGQPYKERTFDWVVLFFSIFFISFFFRGMTAKMIPGYGYAFGRKRTSVLLVLRFAQVFL